jgi:integrase
MKLTDETAAGLAMPGGKIDHIYWDEDLPCFGVRLRASQSLSAVSRNWVVQYRFGTRQRRESLGDVRKVQAASARKAARQRFAKVELGIDPGAEKVKNRVEATAARLTLKHVADRYLAAKQDVLRPRTYNAARLHFTKHWKPLLEIPIDAIRRADVAARLQELIAERGRHSAHAARRNLSAMYGWAMGEGLCENDPVVATNNPAEGLLSRDRVLSDNELAIVWRACGDDDFGKIVRLLILTGCRRDEIGELVWSEINFDTCVLTIPGERIKNHRTLELALPSAALDILRTMTRKEGRDYVFGRGKGYNGWSYSTMALNSRIAAKHGRPLAPWRLHDLRRSMRTGLGRLGVRPDIAELCINHVKGGIEAVYDLHRYQPEIKAALARWATHVSASVEGRESNVVPMRA